jgi:uncharacterized membrane protein
MEANMLELIYDTLQKLGYTHPLHPTLTHLPIGLALASLIFFLVAKIFRKPAYFTTARHCITVAAITVPFAAFLGLMDWQHFYGGAYIFPVKIKFVLAGGLFVLLVIGISAVIRKHSGSSKSLLFYVVYSISVIGLGYFGGELVYGTQKTGTKALVDLPQEGATIFNQNCAMCHYTDQTKTKIGPGLKDLYQKQSMTKSGWKVTDENIRRQLKTPYADMPPFADMSEKEIQAILAYLRTL